MCQDLRSGFIIWLLVKDAFQIIAVRQAIAAVAEGVLVLAHKIPGFANVSERSGVSGYRQKPCGVRGEETGVRTLIRDGLGCFECAARITPGFKPAQATQLH